MSEEVNEVVVVFFFCVVSFFFSSLGKEEDERLYDVFLERHKNTRDDFPP